VESQPVLVEPGIEVVALVLAVVHHSHYSQSGKYR
jgi:hypothetical protein